MADQFRDQINSARRQGFSSAEIIDVLKQSNPQIAEALNQGFGADEILAQLAPPLSTGEELSRKVGVTARGLSEGAIGPLTGATVGATTGALIGLPTGIGAPVGAVVGGLAVPAADALTMAYNKLAGGNVRLPSQVISGWLPGPQAETPTERVLQATGQSVGSTLTGGVIPGRAIVQAATPAVAGVPSTVAPGLQQIGKEAAQRPVAQMLISPTSTAVGQTVTEYTDNPWLGLGASLATGMGLGAATSPARKREAVPTSDELVAQSKASYQKLEQSGLKYDTKAFQQQMKTIEINLRPEGYTPEIAPKVKSALDQLKSRRPKDVIELLSLRKIIGGAASSGDANERRLAMELLDKFDDYMLNAPAQAFVGGDSTAVDAWKAARADYAKVKKAELIQDILYRADVAQGSEEAAIARNLTSLANNEKKMRFFTPDEQQAIRDTAKGGSIQQSLRLVAKFKPMTPAAAIFTAVAPYGAYTASAGWAADVLARSNRLRQVNNLTNRMLLGREPQFEQTPFYSLPTFAGRSAVNALGSVQQEQMQNSLSR